MLDERYSATEFERLGLDSERSRTLANELERDILEELKSTVDFEVKKIAERLNGMGHNLRLEEQSTPGSISFRDDRGEGDNYDCKLRIALDYIASAGYSHLSGF